MRSRVLEKAPEFGEIGYGIQQGPNAYRMLDWLGVMQDLEPQAVFTKNLILIGDGAPQPVGHVSYRGVVPVDQVKDQSHFDDMVIWIGPNLHLVQYRLRGGTVMNNVATVVSGKFARGERHDYGGPEELAEVFSRTTPDVQEMLGYVGKDKNWVLH